MTSHENIHTCLLTVTVCVLVFSVMEVVSYFLYLKWVRIFYNKYSLLIFCKNAEQLHPWINIIKAKKSNSELDEGEDSKECQTSEIKGSKEAYNNTQIIFRQLFIY